MAELLPEELAEVRYTIKRLAKGPGDGIGDIELVNGSLEQLEALASIIETVKRLRAEVIAVAEGHGFEIKEPRVYVSARQISVVAGSSARWEDERSG
jgi:hypothetical protein